MKQSMSFEEAGRTYACTVEPSRTSQTPAWWWFAVSGDSQRYAPFQSDPADTEESVRQRIVAYYELRLARRAMPHDTWGRRDKANPPATTEPGAAGNTPSTE